MRRARQNHTGQLYTSPKSSWHCREAYYPSENGSPGALVGVLHPPATYTGDSSSPPQGPLALSGMRWGLVPSFTKQGSKPDFYKMFNARSETVTSKGIFSRLLKGRRCCPESIATVCEIAVSTVTFSVTEI